MPKSYQKITTYTARHSWATIAKKAGFSIELIAESLGHEYGNRITASIIGIMEIIKGDHYKPVKESLLMMEAAVNELDEKIKGVIKCSEKVLANNYLHSELKDSC